MDGRSVKLLGRRVTYYVWIIFRMGQTLVLLANDNNNDRGRPYYRYAVWAVDLNWARARHAGHLFGIKYYYLHFIRLQKWWWWPLYSVLCWSAAAAGEDKDSPVVSAGHPVTFRSLLILSGVCSQSFSTSIFQSGHNGVVWCTGVMYPTRVHPNKVPHLTRARTPTVAHVSLNNNNRLLGCLIKSLTYTQNAPRNGEWLLSGLVAYLNADLLYYLIFGKVDCCYSVFV